MDLDHTVFCLVCMMDQRMVPGDVQDFAHRCPRHLPDERPHVIYMHPDLARRVFEAMYPRLIQT